MPRPRTRLLALAGGLVLVGTVGAFALPALADDSTGTIAGQITDAGTPQAYAYISVFDLDYNYVDGGPAGPDGTFSFVEPAGSYKISLTPSGGLTQWAHGKLSFDTADTITVTGGATTTVDEAVVAHGSITGHVTNADGSPAAYVQVAATDYTNGSISEYATADGDGAYTLPVLPTGDYRVTFQLNFSSPLQYANNTTSYDAATAIHVNNGDATTLDQQLLANGTIAGTLIDHSHPVANAYVSINSTDGALSGWGITAADGSYSVNLAPSTYVVSFQLPSGLQQYAYRQLDYTKAAQITVTAGATAVVNDKVLPTGTISGHLVDADGNPVANAGVSVANATTSAYTNTDDTGAYQVTAFAGTYQVSFGTDAGTQWAHGQTSAATADPITVTANQILTLDETLARTGSLTVEATDSQTHAAISSFCLYVNQANLGQSCTDTGSVTVAGLLPGRYSMSVYSPEGDNTYLNTSVSGVIITSATTTDQPVVLAKAATVTASVTDARTGTPVANACLWLVATNAPIGLELGPRVCTDAGGQLALGQVAPATYKAFVTVEDGVHGDQWVGSAGGVGAFKKAVTLTIGAGDTVALPPVKLDRAGSISGTMTDAGTGLPLRYGEVCLSSFSAGEGGGGHCTVTDIDGHYTMSDLGPYQWTLFETAPYHAAVFSGGTPNRDQASGVKVRAGATSTWDVALGTGTTLTGKVFGPGGQKASFARVTVINANSNDEMGNGDIARHPYGYTAAVTGPQKVKLWYDGSVNGVYYSGFVGGTDRASATVFSIPASGTKTITITMTQLAG